MVERKGGGSRHRRGGAGHLKDKPNSGTAGRLRNIVDTRFTVKLRGGRPSKLCVCSTSPTTPSLRRPSCALVITGCSMTLSITDAALRSNRVGTGTANVPGSFALELTTSKKELTLVVGPTTSIVLPWYLSDGSATTLVKAGEGIEVRYLGGRVRREGGCD